MDKFKTGNFVPRKGKHVLSETERPFLGASSELPETQGTLGLRPRVMSFSWGSFSHLVVSSAEALLCVPSPPRGKWTQGVHQLLLAPQPKRLLLPQCLFLLHLPHCSQLYRAIGLCFGQRNMDRSEACHFQTWP